MMTPSDFKIFISVESFNEKTTETYGYCYVTENRVFSKLSRPNLLCFPENKPTKSVAFESGQARPFHRSKYLTSPKMVIKIYFSFSDFFKGFRTA